MTLDPFFTDRPWHPNLRRRAVIEEWLPDGRIATARYEWNKDLPLNVQALELADRLVALDEVTK